ncbi:L,D-transpeptidase [Mesorhizobium xinjiangense]|uniref:L,D-transpeptidase n=1 Tax=Mesorhizobium xinjiangense TaxID=2678685 RepID=UPI0012EDC986|nr:L,D-transpeptidase [Mesorhizobium xinjiangense]
MKSSPCKAGLAVALALAASQALADDRYAERPPLVVSPDLTAPWVTQLRRATVGGPIVNERRYDIPGTSERGLRVMMRPRDARPVQRQAPPPAARSPKTVHVVRPAPQPNAGNVKAGLDPKYLPQQVAYDGPERPGTIIIDTNENFLYHVQPGGTARRYGVGTGKPGFEWAGTHKVTQKREWPDWRPPAEMIARERKKGRILPVHMAGGPDNPLGARALYLGSTLYRVHGTNQPSTIGRAVSSGCIRMRNQDVIELYERVDVGTKVVVM